MTREPIKAGPSQLQKQGCRTVVPLSVTVVVVRDLVVLLVCVLLCAAYLDRCR